MLTSAAHSARVVETVSTITFPPFSASQQQKENMLRLIQLLLASINSKKYMNEIVEINRELGRFTEAAGVLNHLNADETDNLYCILSSLIREKNQPLFDIEIKAYSNISNNNLSKTECNFARADPF